MDQETFQINIEVRTAKGEILSNSEGTKFPNLGTMKLLSSEENLGRQLLGIAEHIHVWTGKKHNVRVVASTYNSISNTYDFYVDAVITVAVKPPMRVLFGRDACEAHDEGIEVLREYMEEDSGYAIESFEEDATVVEVLSAGDGWNDYHILTEEEYQQLEDLL